MLDGSYIGFRFKRFPLANAEGEERTDILVVARNLREAAAIVEKNYPKSDIALVSYGVEELREAMLFELCEGEAIGLKILR